MSSGMLFSAALHRIRRAVLSHWLISYSLVIIIPFIAFSVYYSRTMVTIEKANYEVCSQELSNAKQAMDASFSQMRSTALQLSADQQVKSIASKTQVTNYEHYLFGCIIRKLQTYTTTDSRFFDIGVIKTDLNLMLTHSRVTTISADGVPTLGNDVILRIMEGQLLNHFFFNPDNETLVFVHTVDRTWRMDGRVKCYLYVVLDRSIWQNIERMTGSNAFMVYFNDELIVQNNTNCIEPKLSLNSSGAFDGIEYRMGFADSEAFRRIEALRRMSMSLSLITLLVCGSLIAYFIHKNYRPIRRLIEQAVTGGDKQEDEFTQIERSIAMLKENNSQLKRELSRQTERGEEASIIRLLSGMGDDSDLELLNKTTLFSSGVSGCYSIIKFGVLNTPDEAESELPLDEVSISVRLESFMKMKTCPADCYRILYLDGLYTLILRLQEQDLQIMIEQICAEFPDMMKALHTPVCLGISSSGTDIHQLHTMANEAKESYEYCVMYNAPYLCYQQLPTMLISENVTGEMPLRDIQWQFFERIEALQFLSASELINELLPDGLPLHLARLNIYTIINLYRVSLNKLGQRMPWVRDIAEYMVSSLLECSNSIIALRTKLNEYLGELNERTKEGIGQKHAITVQAIMEYIQTHYNDPQLSVKWLADQFNMSPSAISRLFSSKTGGGLLDYIHSVRIGRAKELLKQNKYTVSEIVEMVGYLSSSTFIRVFKKYVGISPGNYSMIQAENSQNIT